jgi:protein-S-isoprenylcysteine O-methyltransferase Ste14
MRMAGATAAYRLASGPYSSIAATDMLPWSQIIAENVWWICALIFMAIRLPHIRQARRDPVKLSVPPASDFILLRIGEVAFGVLPLAYILFKVPGFANYPWFPPFVVIGTLVFLCGIWIIYRAHKDLGRSFSYTLEIRHEHELVSNGIYRYIRHPMYAAFLLWTIAQAMLLPNWVVGLAAPLVLATLLAIRVPREEGMMLQTFGDGYRAYMGRTARFIPGVF